MNQIEERRHDLCCRDLGWCSDLIDESLLEGELELVSQTEELWLPLPSIVEALVLVARSAAPTNRREPSLQTVGEPRMRVGAEAILFGSEAQVQVAGRYQRSARMLPPERTSQGGYPAEQ